MTNLKLYEFYNLFFLLSQLLKKIFLSTYTFYKINNVYIALVSQPILFKKVSVVQFITQINIQIISLKLGFDKTEFPFFSSRDYKGCKT